MVNFSEDAADNVNGVERDPGAIQRCRTPVRDNAANKTPAQRRLKTDEDMVNVSKKGAGF
jgi:hypothetical protein